MEAKLDMALDDLVKNNRGGGRGRGGRGGRGGGSSSRGGGGRFRGGDGGGNSSGGPMRHGRGGRGGRPAPYSKRTSSDDVAVWTHDRFEETEGGHKSEGGNRRGAGAASGDVTKVLFENIFSVTTEELERLLQQDFDLEGVQIDFDRSGRSTGQALALFRKKSDADACVKKYDKGILEGNTLSLKIVEPGFKFRVQRDEDGFGGDENGGGSDGGGHRRGGRGRGGSFRSRGSRGGGFRSGGGGSHRGAGGRKITFRGAGRGRGRF